MIALYFALFALETILPRMHHFAELFSQLYWTQMTLPTQGQIHSSQAKILWVRLSRWWHIWAPWDLSKAGLGVWTSRSKTWHGRHNAVECRCKSALGNISARIPFCPLLYLRTLQSKALNLTIATFKILPWDMVWPGAYYKICQIFHIYRVHCLE